MEEEEVAVSDLAKTADELAVSAGAIVVVNVGATAGTVEVEIADIVAGARDAVEVLRPEHQHEDCISVD